MGIVFFLFIHLIFHIFASQPPHTFWDPHLPPLLFFSVGVVRSETFTPRNRKRNTAKTRAWLAKKTIISLQWLISSWDLPAVNHGCYGIYFLNTTSVILCRRVSKRKFAIGWSECTSIKTNGRTLLDQNYSKQRISWRMNDFFIEKWIFTKLLQWNRSK